MGEDPFEILVKEPERGLRLIMAKHGNQLKKRIKNIINNDDELVKDAVSETLIALFVQREKKDRKVSIDELRIVPHSQEIEADLHYQEMLEVVLSKAEQLSPMEKKVLIDAKVHGLNNKELETRHDLKPQRVRNLLSTALAKIRRLLKGS